MQHDPTKVALGTTKGEATIHTFKGEREAGLALRLKSDGSLSITSSDGQFLGVSVGKDLANAKHTAVARDGFGVPILLTNGFNPTVGDAVIISNSTGMAANSGTTTAAIYASGRMDNCVGEDGASKSIALIDFPGGL